MWTVGLGLVAALTGDTTIRPWYINLALVEIIWLLFNLWLVLIAIGTVAANRSENKKIWVVGMVLFMLLSVTGTILITCHIVK
jgi:hypothetical protein